MGGLSSSSTLRGRPDRRPGSSMAPTPRLMSRTAVIGALFLLALSGAVLPAHPQSSVEDPITPRGSILVEVRPTSRFVDRLYGRVSGAEIPLGEAFLVPDLDSGLVPALAPVEERFRSLAGGHEGTALRLGASVGRFTADEQLLPIRVSYGALDRITIGATFPFVRKRVDALLRLSPEGANVGANPAAFDATQVAAFQQGAAGALSTLRTSVESDCSELGRTHPVCIDGETLVSSIEGFLAGMDAAWAQELVFPLSGSTLGTLIQERWSDFRTELFARGADAPESLPLATSPVGNAAFRSLAVEPAWPGNGFPIENLPSFLTLGDIEVHLALALPQLGSGVPGSGGWRVRSAVVGTARLPTGEPDSLRAMAPTGPPRGVGGAEIRVVSDVTLTERLAFLLTAESGWNGSRDISLLALDPSRVYSPGQTRAPVRWEPGGHLGFSLSPRVHLGQGLSLGAGWEFLRRGAESYTPLQSSDLQLPESGETTSAHTVALEFRYAALGGPMSPSMRFPMEILLRGARSISGNGAPVERRFDLAMRVLLRR